MGAPVRWVELWDTAPEVCGMRLVECEAMPGRDRLRMVLGYRYGGRKMFSEVQIAGVVLRVWNAEPARLMTMLVREVLKMGPAQDGLLVTETSKHHDG